MSINGRVLSINLKTVQGKIQLERNTANAFIQMRADAARHGVALLIPTPAGGYRPLWMQLDMKLHPGAYNLDPHSSVPVADPGNSTHGDGTRVDIVIGAGREWAIRNAERYGFFREFGDRDPGHFHYVGVKPIKPAGGNVKPLPIPKKKVPDMVLIENTNPAKVNYRYAAVGETSFDLLKSPTVPIAVTRESRLWGVPLKVSQVEFDQFLAQVNQRRAGENLPPIVWPTAA